MAFVPTSGSTPRSRTVFPNLRSPSQMTITEPMRLPAARPPTRMPVPSTSTLWSLTKAQMQPQTSVAQIPDGEGLGKLDVGPPA